MGKHVAGVTETKGRDALEKALEARGWNQADLARELECHSGLVNRWMHGRRVPGRHWSGEIERVTGVKAALWGEPSKHLSRTG